MQCASYRFNADLNLRNVKHPGNFGGKMISSFYLIVKRLEFPRAGASCMGTRLSPILEDHDGISFSLWREKSQRHGGHYCHIKQVYQSARGKEKLRSFLLTSGRTRESKDCEIQDLLFGGDNLTRMVSLPHCCSPFKLVTLFLFFWNSNFIKQRSFWCLLRNYFCIFCSVLLPWGILSLTHTYIFHYAIFTII